MLLPGDIGSVTSETEGWLLLLPSLWCPGTFWEGRDAPKGCLPREEGAGAVDFPAQRHLFLLSIGAANVPSAQERQLFPSPPVLKPHSRVIHSDGHATRLLGQTLSWCSFPDIQKHQKLKGWRIFFFVAVVLFFQSKRSSLNS